MRTAAGPIAFWVVIAMISPNARANSSATLELQFKQARTLYYEGTYGDKDAGKQAEELLSVLYKEMPNDSRVKAYYGSECLLNAAHTWAVWKKYSLSKEGIELMDAAVEASPQNLEVRFVRAVTTYHLPGFFGRKEQAEGDFQYLSTRVAEAAKNGTLEPSIAASALLFYGRICIQQSKTAQATSAWRMAAAIAPESKAGIDSAEELAKIKG